MGGSQPATDFLEPDAFLQPPSHPAAINITESSSWSFTGRCVCKPPVQAAVECAAEKPAKTRKKRDKVSTCAEKDGYNEPHVYEFRKRKEINYMHVEAPGDDEFLYCEECNLNYPHDCPVHGPIHVVFDTGVPADGSDPDRTLHTLPHGLEIHSESRQSHFKDAKDCSVSNWMRYVNCPCTETDQNLTAYQHRGQIYRSHCDIQPGTELLVWYGSEYGRELSIELDKACRSSGREGAADGVFSCPHCRLAFSDCSYFERQTHT